MSTALAIAAVTAVLKDLLLDGIIDGGLTTAVGDVTVSALPPDRIKVGTDEKSQLNIFMYRTTPNQGWRNTGLPSRSENGTRTSNPPLAVDLHYMISAYGARDFHSEILLGYAMQLLHEIPVLTRDGIRTTLSPGANLPGTDLPPALRALATAALAEQVEQIKICPAMVDNEDMSRLWSAFQAPYRPSAYYLISVVLIQSRQRTRSALPVEKSRIFVLPFNRPVIEEVSPQIVKPNDTLTASGFNLKGPVTHVLLESGAVTPTLVKDAKLLITVPTNLQAGLRTFQVLHQLDLGTDQEPHRYLESNVMAFLLAPQITTAPPINVAHGASLTLDVSPQVGREQEVGVIIGDRLLPVPPRAASAPLTSPTITVSIPSDFPPGMYLLRVRVDGVESSLGKGSDGKFNSPQVKVT